MKKSLTCPSCGKTPVYTPMSDGWMLSCKTYSCFIATGKTKEDAAKVWNEPNFRDKEVKNA